MEDAVPCESSATMGMASMGALGKSADNSQTCRAGKFGGSSHYAMERTHRERGETILNPETIARILSGLQLFPFFPQSGDAFDALVRMVGKMAETEDQVRWLVDRMLLNPIPNGLVLQRFVPCSALASSRRMVFQ